MIRGLPNGWCAIDLNEATIYSKGKKPKKLSINKSIGMVPYINIKAFEWGVIEEYADESSSKLIDENDVLVVWDGARFGLTGMGIKGAAGSTLMVLTPVLNNSKYICYFINRSYTYINSKPKGSGTPHVNPNIFWKIQFPLAPLNEQKRIVAKLDKIIPRIDKVKDRLEKIPVIIKRFRQSVLTAAVSGKLTETWREEHPEVKSNSEALSKLPTKFENNYLNVFEETKNGNLPDTWRNIPLVNLGEIKGGGTPSKSNPEFWKGTIPWISPKDMKVSKIANGKDFITKEAIDNSSVNMIPKSSILFVVRGMILAHTFPSAITLNDVTINQDMKAFIPNKWVNAEFMLLAFKQAQNRVLEYIKEATHGTLRLEMSVIQTFAFPIPPIEEQKEIVRQVDKLFALADKLEEHYKKAKTKVDRLSQSVLAKAFRGELVITEAELAEREGRDFESAEKLLERIQQEKERLSQGAQRTRRKKCVQSS
jgi:type I restriction enzyme, S subunit